MCQLLISCGLEYGRKRSALFFDDTNLRCTVGAFLSDGWNVSTTVLCRKVEQRSAPEVCSLGVHYMDPWEGTNQRRLPRMDVLFDVCSMCLVWILGDKCTFSLTLSV